MIHDHGNAAGTPCCPICCWNDRPPADLENGLSHCREHKLEEAVAAVIHRAKVGCYACSHPNENVTHQCKEHIEATREALLAAVDDVLGPGLMLEQTLGGPVHVLLADLESQLDSVRARIEALFRGPQSEEGE